MCRVNIVIQHTWYFVLCWYCGGGVSSNLAFRWEALPTLWYFPNGNELALPDPSLGSIRLGSAQLFCWQVFNKLLNKAWAHAPDQADHQTTGRSTSINCVFWFVRNDHQWSVRNNHQWLSPDFFLSKSAVYDLKTISQDLYFDPYIWIGCIQGESATYAKTVPFGRGMDWDNKIWLGRSKTL